MLSIIFSIYLFKNTPPYGLFRYPTYSLWPLSFIMMCLCIYVFVLVMFRRAKDVGYVLLKRDDCTE